MTLGEKIYKLRNERNLSQADLAEALDVSRQSISKWETDASVPELDKLVKMSVFFSVSLDELILNKTHDGQPDFSKPKTIYTERPGVSCIVVHFCSIMATDFTIGIYFVRTHLGRSLCHLWHHLSACAKKRRPLVCVGYLPVY